MHRIKVASGMIAGRPTESGEYRDENWHIEVHFLEPGMSSNPPRFSEVQEVVDFVIRSARGWPLLDLFNRQGFNPWEDKVKPEVGMTGADEALAVWLYDAIAEVLSGRSDLNKRLALEKVAVQRTGSTPAVEYFEGMTSVMAKLS